MSNDLTSKEALDALVEETRQRAETIGGFYCDRVHDTIEALRRERSGAYDEGFADGVAAGKATHPPNERLEAEKARLREALRSLLSVHLCIAGEIGLTGAMEKKLESAHNEAIEALKETDDE